MAIEIRQFKHHDLKQLLAIFGKNIPQFFAPHEMAEYVDYLTNYPSNYFVIEYEGAAAGGAGYRLTGNGVSGSITWIFFDPMFKGHGLGRMTITYLMKELKVVHKVDAVQVRTSQLAYRFFEKFGFEITSTTKDFWAPGLDLYEMSIPIVW